jgi:hypothetical protein
MTLVVIPKAFGKARRFEKGKIVDIDGCKFAVEDVSTNLMTVRPLTFDEIEAINIRMKEIRTMQLGERNELKTN